MDAIGSDKKINRARIDPKHRVADEDYFRVVKESKIMASLKQVQNEKAMARTRFDEKEPATRGTRALADQDEKEEAELKTAAHHKSTNPYTIRYIDPHLEPFEAIQKIQLPAMTMYLIDKVVRAKALQGPIGVDNSEVINLEQERELRQRNKYLANLAAQKKGGTGDSDEDNDSEEQEDEADMDEQERENRVNEKLLQRLYKAAQNELDQGEPERHYEGQEKSAMGGVDRAVLEMHTKTDSERKVHLNHDMWVRVKEHQERLRKVLVHEAKKDLYEKLVQE